MLKYSWLEIGSKLQWFLDHEGERKIFQRYFLLIFPNLSQSTQSSSRYSTGRVLGCVFLRMWAGTNREGDIFMKCAQWFRKLIEPELIGNDQCVWKGACVFPCFWLVPATEISYTSIWKAASWAGVVTQPVECLLCKHEVLSSNSSPDKINKNKDTDKLQVEGRERTSQTVIQKQMWLYQ